MKFLKLPIFFIFLILILSPATAGVQRSTQLSEAYFNGTFVYNTIEVTLTPDNYANFDIPGYYVTEYLPPNLEFKSTNADWYSISDRKLSMMRVLPPANNFTIKYTLKIPINSPTSNYTFYGTYKDENKNTGEINSSDVKYISEKSSSSSPTPEKTYLTPAPTETPSFIPNLTLPANISLNIINISANSTENLSPENTTYSIIILILFLASLIVLKQYKKTSKHITIPIKILPNKIIFINYKVVTLPFKLDIKNTFNKTIFPIIKIDKTLPLTSYPNTISIEPQAEGYFNITDAGIESNKDYSGNITIKWN